MTDPKEIASQLVRLVPAFRWGGQALFSIIAETGYFDRHLEVTEEVLLDALRKEDPALPREWLTYSESKRTDSGCYIWESDRSFRVGYREKNGRYTRETSYSDLAEACARFIKMELDELRPQASN